MAYALVCTDGTLDPQYYDFTFYRPEVYFDSRAHNLFYDQKVPLAPSDDATTVYTGDYFPFPIVEDTLPQRTWASSAYFVTDGYGGTLGSPYDLGMPPPVYMAPTVSGSNGTYTIQVNNESGYEMPTDLNHLDVHVFHFGADSI